MRNFMKEMMDWILDKEEASADHCAIPANQIEKQIETIQKRKEKYEAECNDTLHQLNHMIVRLEKMLDKAKSCGGE